MGQYDHLIKEYSETNRIPDAYDYDDLYKVSAYIDFKNIMFDIDETIKEHTGLPLKQFRELSPLSLTNTVERALLNFIRAEQSPDGTKVLERMAEFSSLVRYRGAEYYLFGSNNMEACDAEVEWTDKTKTRIRTNFYLSGIDDLALIRLPLDEEIHPDPLPLNSALTPLDSELDGDFEVDEVYI